MRLLYKPLLSLSGKPLQGLRGRGAEPHIKKDLSKKQDSMLLDTAILKEALEHYALDNDKLDALASTAINVVKSMWQQYRETTRGLIGEMVKKAGKSGMERDKVVQALKTKGLEEGLVEDVIDELIQEKRCYELDIGVLKC
ncbi:MAG: hypothetical protein QMD22_07700 [archaeon]|nr:hypothetical protein [archaeon]